MSQYKFRFIDQPAGWLGEKAHPDVPYITNLCLDPFERTDWPTVGTKDGSLRLVQVPILPLRVFVSRKLAREIRPSSRPSPMQRVRASI
jgi:arylsulfatase